MRPSLIQRRVRDIECHMARMSGIIARLCRSVGRIQRNRWSISLSAEEARDFKAEMKAHKVDDEDSRSGREKPVKQA